MRSGTEGDQTIASLNALRGHAMQRLSAVQDRLQSKGVGAAKSFTAASRGADNGDTGFFMTMLFDMLFGGTGNDLFSDLGLSDNFNVASAVCGMEFYSLMSDQRAYGYRRRKLNDYPEGRRRAYVAESKMSGRFNLISANQNNRFSFDIQAELACLFEILDMIDGLERMGASRLKVSRKKPLYETLRHISARATQKGVVRSFSPEMALTG